MLENSHSAKLNELVREKIDDMKKPNFKAFSKIFK